VAHPHALRVVGLLLVELAGLRGADRHTAILPIALHSFHDAPQ
jgi:hypothetical protein